MRTSLLAIALITHAAWADAPVSAKDKQRYAEALAAGRKLANAKHYPEAIAAFEGAVASFPDDPTLLAELGYTAFLAKDLKKAEAMTRRALAAQASPSIRGASLYNLGLIQEARGDKAGAIASYAESLRERPHSVVRAALAKLAPAAAVATEPYAPVSMAGPYASLAAYCKARPTEDDSGSHACTCDKVMSAPVKLAAPFEAFQGFTRACDTSGQGRLEWLAAVKVATGWYVASVSNGIWTLKCEDEMHFDAPALVDGRLRMPYAGKGSCITMAASNTWSEDGVVVIGIGPSKLPAATPMIGLHHAESGAGAEIAVALTITWGKDGAFETAGKTTGVDKKEAQNLVGAHVLVFP